MDLSEKIISIIEKYVEQNIIIKPEYNLIEDLGIDSFGRLMIINDIEDEFKISIAEEDLNNIKTVNDIILNLKKTVK